MIALLTILSIAFGQSLSVRVIRQGEPTGQFLDAGDDDYTAIQQPDGQTELVLFSPANVEAVHVRVIGDWTEAYICEHLGQRIDLTTAPPDGGLPVSTYPGLLQAPLVMGGTADQTVFLGSLDLGLSVRVVATRQTVGINFYGPFEANVPHSIRFLYATYDLPGASHARERVARLANRYRRAMPALGFPAPDALKRSQGVACVNGQNEVAPELKAASLLATGPGLAGIALWGVAADYGGECCLSDQTIHPRYNGVFGLGVPVWAYTRSNLPGSVWPNPPWWESWLFNHQVRGLLSYGDAVGYRILPPEMVPADAIIEGASIAYRCPALVSNAFSGGGFRLTEDGEQYPYTLPDGRPHSKSTRPWMTAAPYIGAMLEAGRVMLAGPQNNDGFWWAPDTTFDGKTWYYPGPRAAFVYDLWLAPTEINPVVEQILAERQRVHWKDQNREWQDQTGVTGIPSGVQLGTWVARGGGGRPPGLFMALDITEMDAASPWTLTWNGRPVPKPTKALSIVSLR